MQKFDWRVTIKTNMMMLRVVGLWPEGDDFHSDLYTLYAIISINLFINGHVFFQTMHIFSVYKDLEALTGTIFITLTQMLASVKVYCFVQNIKILKELLTALNCEEFQPRNDAQRDLVGFDLGVWRTIYKAFSVLVGATLLLFVMFPVLDEGRKLPFAAWYPFDTAKSPLYELTYCYQAVSIWFLATANLNMDTIIPALMMYTGGQCDILCNNLKDLKRANFSKQIVACIRHHNAILRFASNRSVSLLKRFFQFR